MRYATIEQVKIGFKNFTADQEKLCEALIDEAGIIIDSVAKTTTEDKKRLVTCRMVRRAIGNSNEDYIPMGATQGSIAALGYSQSWTMGNGSTGELYLSKQEKQILGLSNKIGTYSTIESMVEQND